MDIREDKKGIAEIFPDLPIMKVCDTLFIFDMSKDIAEKIKIFLNDNKMTSINLFQLNIYRKIEEYSEGLEMFYEYIIFDNQRYCENVTVLTITDEHLNAAKSVIEKKSTSITKFGGRKWPVEDNVILFRPISGSGSISPGPEFTVPKKIISWFWTLTHKDEYDKDCSDPLNPIIYDKDKPEDKDKLIPGIEIDIPDNGYTHLYELKYFYNIHTTEFAFDENVTRILPGMAMTNSSKENNITIEVRKPVSCTVIPINDDAESYIYNKRCAAITTSSYKKLE